MAWGVFYRPQGSTWEGSPAIPVSSHQQPGGFVKEYYSYPVSSANYTPQHPPQKPVLPHFRTPLSEAVLNDPAFSADPRSHPHFPFTDARSYKALPAKSPRSTVLPAPTLNEPTTQQSIKYPITPAPAKTAKRPFPPALPVSLEHEFHAPKSVASTPSTVSSITTIRPPLVQTQGSRTTIPSVSRTSTSSDPPPYNKYPSNHNESSGAPTPGTVRPPMSYTTPSKIFQARVKPRPKVTPARADTKSNFARISASKGRIKNLVRRLTTRHHLDRIDELDETDPFGIGFHHSGPYEAIASNLAEETSPLSHNLTDKFTGRRNNSKFESDTTKAAQPPRLDTEPSLGNQTSVDTGRTADEISTHEVQVGTMSAVPRETTTKSIQSDYTRLQPLPNQTVHPPQLYPVVNQSPPPIPAPRVHHFGDIIPRIPGKQTPYINPPPAPYVPEKPQLTTYSHESVPHNPSPPRSPKRLPNTNHMASQPAQSDGGRPVADLQPLHSTLPKSASSSDVSHSAPARTPCGHGKPPRVQHLPKRLVMPAPLHIPQASEQPSRRPFPNPDGRTAINPVSVPSRTNQTQKLRRKKSATFPSSVPLPLRPSTYQPDVGQTIVKNLANAAVKGQGIHQEPRRRRLRRKLTGQIIKQRSSPSLNAL
ncbi:hypothetical protein F5J12DRAFT_768140 [Pisolithus orientalis]|uniref:uncharacterized protein n=1 Tax=Pisolithus orientalis TaxID=936130 RepID=UPI00222497EC|nr:uncharacterized protein F5J12DRAFT_768140 [Pisolithus orientalis]KAI6008351.1 hypothetical protein F5J12DRAFT_768140 [Pisolithus orientalis]